LSLRTHHLIVLLLAGAMVFSSLAFLAVDSPAQAACATGTSVVITKPGPNSSATSAVSGITELRAQSTPTTASGLSFMVVGPTQKTLGEATFNSGVWSLMVDTRNHANGTYQLMATARFGTATTLNCASPVVPLAIHNTPTQAPKLAANITPEQWQGSPAAGSPFTVAALYTDQFGRNSLVSPTNVTWMSSIGRLAPTNEARTVFTAPTATVSGLVKAEITYNGLVAYDTAPVKVVSAAASSSPTPTPTTETSAPRTASTANSEPLAPAEAARLAAMPTIFRPAQPTNSNPVVSLPTLSCFEKAVGGVRFAEISSGASQPTADERKRAAACFSGPEPIPSVLAPVAPNAVAELERTTNLVAVGSVKNQTITNSEGKKVNGLVLSGTGVPGSSVFLYVFSDPLVLRAETDDKGTWQYVLETPLASGKHEVYAVAERDTGTFVRSTAVPIQIAAAAPTAAGGNLLVGRTWSSAQVAFVGGAGLMVLLALGLLLSLLRRRHKTAVAAGPAAAPTVTPVNVAVTPTLIQPSTKTPPPDETPH
jgi:hypothetical protein